MWENESERIRKNKWNRYLVYLVQWTVDHDYPFFYGMSPVGFDEWEDNEYVEEKI